MGFCKKILQKTRDTCFSWLRMADDLKLADRQLSICFIARKESIEPAPKSFAEY